MVVKLSPGYEKSSDVDSAVCVSVCGIGVPASFVDVGMFCTLSSAVEDGSTKEGLEQAIVDIVVRATI